MVLEKIQDRPSILPSEIDYLDGHVACRRQQLPMIASTGTHGPGTDFDRPTIGGFRKAGCGVNGVKGKPATGAKQSSGSSQHGELGSESTQDIAVDDHVKAC